jgi:hypothetical protein
MGSLYAQPLRENVYFVIWVTANSLMAITIYGARFGHTRQGILYVCGVTSIRIYCGILASVLRYRRFSGNSVQDGRYP